MKLFCLVVLLFGGGVFLNFAPVLGASVEQKDEAFISQFQLAKSRYMNARGEYLRGRAQFITSRDQFHANKGSGETTLEKAKTTLLAADQTAIQYFELLRAVAQSYPSIEESDRSLLVGELSQDIAWLTQKEQEIQVATSRNDLVSLGIVIREYWRDARATSRRVAGQILATDINRIAQRFEVSRDLIAKKIEQAKNEGKDTTALEQFLSNYQSQLQSTEELVNRGRLQFQSIQSLEEGDAAFQTGHRLLLDATQALRAAHQTLLSLLSELDEQALSDSPNINE